MTHRIEIFQNRRGWWFWEEDYIFEHGPYKTKEHAIAGLEMYVSYRKVEAILDAKKEEDKETVTKEFDLLYFSAD